MYLPRGGLENCSTVVVLFDFYDENRILEKIMYLCAFLSNTVMTYVSCSMSNLNCINETLYV